MAIVECVFRITTVQDRSRLGSQWFPSHAVRQAFGRIQESEFETVSRLLPWILHFIVLEIHLYLTILINPANVNQQDCRDVLNLLNSGAGENRRSVTGSLGF